MVGWWLGRGLPMLRYRKNLAIIAAISLALNLQGVGAVADEASSSGTVGNQGWPRT